ncbi:Hypothetical protein SCF082_LOCUS22808, partial [Durusdinium trenchii]
MSSRCRCIERCISPCPHRSSSEREARQPQEEVPEYSVQVDGFEPARRGRHVIYSLTIRRGDAHWPIRRRFRQDRVAKLHEQLLLGFGRSSMKSGLPRLPPKVTCRSLFFGQQDQRFLQMRA